MPFSHHSHSGQFCNHANNTLEEVITTAIAKGFTTFALTEHIPRSKEDFYPEEEQVHTEQSLAKQFEDYVEEAVRLRRIHSSEINLMIGFESEWIRPKTQEIISHILDKYHGEFDFFLGSVHHVHTFPIDFDDVTYQKAKHQAGGVDERLFENYFDAQYEMLTALKPPIVGHFDLIRLKSTDPNTEFEGMKSTWEKIRRNLATISSYGGILELNSAALRKGLEQPYPCLPICRAFLSMGGRLTISDDSHGIDQVATNYSRLLDFIRKAGIKEIWFADRNAAPFDTRFKSGFSSMALSELEKHAFWVRNREIL